MIKTEVFHIEVEEESDYTKRFIYRNESTGLPMDLTGYRAELQMKNDTNFEISISLTTEPGEGITLGGTSGTIDIEIGYLWTCNVLWTKGIYTLTLIRPDSVRLKYAKGFFNVIPGINHIRTSILPDISSYKISPYPVPNNYDKAAESKIEIIVI